MPRVPFGVSAERESWVKFPCGLVMAFDGENNSGTGYVRFLDKNGGEVAYWDQDEWMESPAEVMGAICGAMLHYEEVDFTITPESFYRFGPDTKFPKKIDKLVPAYGT